jgi:hypothetical protein
VIGAFTDDESAPAMAQTAKSGTYCTGRPKRTAIKPSRLPESAPTDKIGIKMPPGTPLPKLVLVNSSLTTSKIAISAIPLFALSANLISPCPPPMVSGKNIPHGSAISSAIQGLTKAGSLLYRV